MQKNQFYLTREQQQRIIQRWLRQVQFYVKSAIAIALLFAILTNINVYVLDT